MKIKRRIKGKTSHYDIHTETEAENNGISYTYWKDAKPGYWALTDDGYVSECFDRKDYTDKSGNLKTFVKLTCGVGWNTRFSKILFEENHKYGVYSKTKPARTWEDEESGRARAKNTVSAYANMVLNDGQIDFEQLGQIYRPDQEIPRATVQRFLKRKVAKKMVEEKIQELLESKEVTKDFAIDNILRALHMAESKGDVNNFLKANDYIMDLLDMKPGKKMITDTIQIDVSKKIAETIEKEYKRIMLSRSSEEDGR